MSPDQRDLRDLLAAAGAEERAAADPLDVAALLGRAHRRRAVRGTTYSAVGLGAAAAIVLGAVSADGLWRDDEPPAPPATETTESTARPSATPTAEPAEAATPTPDAFVPDWELCGTEDASDEPGPFGLEHDALLAGITDEPFPVDATLTSAQDVGEVTASIVGAYAVEWRDQLAPVVVGVAGAQLDADVAGRLDASGTLALPHADVPITSCEASPLTGGDGALTTTLDPAGLYGLMLKVEVTTADGVTTRQDFWAFSLGTDPSPIEPELGSPADGWTIRETLPGGAQRVPLDSAVRVTGGWGHTGLVGPEMEDLCGVSSTPWPLPWLTTMGANNHLTPPPPDDVANRFGVTATGFRDGADLVVRVTTTYTGTAVNDAWIASPGVTVVKDGRIIGWRYMWNMAYAPATWGNGQTVQLELPLGEFTCTFMNGEPWPAGTYEVYVQQAMDVLPQTGYATRWSYGAEGGPFTFTLD